MSNEFKLVPFEATEEMLNSVTTTTNVLLRAEIVRMAKHDWASMLAAAPQPPALGVEPEVVGYRCRQGETENWTISTTPDYWEHKPVVLLDDHRAHLTPLQAEIGRLKADRDYCKRVAAHNKEMGDQLKARCDEMEALLNESLPALDQAASAFKRCKPIRDRVRAALSKPAGSEQAPPLEIPSRTIRLSGCEFTEEELLRRAVRAVRGSRRNTMPRWGLVRDAFGTGSGVATALCRRFGFDPEEVLKS